MPQEYIEIHGARENNLKNVSLRIPKRKITIFTGVSGSGKSSIVFDTIANESQMLDPAEIKDIGGGGLIASVKDENGNIIGLIQ